MVSMSTCTSIVVLWNSMTSPQTSVLVPVWVPAWENQEWVSWWSFSTSPRKKFNFARKLYLIILFVFECEWRNLEKLCACVWMWAIFFYFLSKKRLDRIRKFKIRFKQPDKNELISFVRSIGNFIVPIWSFFSLIN